VNASCSTGFLSVNKGDILRVNCMKKIVEVVAVGLLVSWSALADNETEPQVKVPSDAVGDEFLELGEPNKDISGAYVGAGCALSCITLDVSASRGSGGEITVKDTAVRPDISLIGGFGAQFYKQYHAGIEMELFKRLGGKTVYHSNGDIGVMHSGTIGLNMDIRVGRHFAQQGVLVYGTVGFARVLGHAHNARIGQNGSFGSFYPSFGVGVAKKMNHRWTAQFDLRMAIPSKDGDKLLGEWTYGGKPSRTAVRLSMVHGF
jgi:hypothetical protein